jgi:hypothetical protein
MKSRTKLVYFFSLIHEYACLISDLSSPKSWVEGLPLNAMGFAFSYQDTAADEASEKADERLWLLINVGVVEDVRQSTKICEH